MNGGYDAQRAGASLGVSEGVLAAAHELKSPLALIRQLSSELSSGRLTDSQRQIIEHQIRLVSERALRLTTDLTKSATLQAELFATESLQPRMIVEEVRGELTPLYEAHNRALRSVRRAYVPPVIANRDLLRRVLCNFADNALFYTTDDQVVELFVQLQREKGKVRIGVRDYGPPLATVVWRSVRSGHAEQPLVSMAERPASSGLGLQIAMQFAAAMGGTIGAIRHKRGASFYIELPISRQLSLL